jgi:GntR family transcriptional regulator
MSLNQSTSQKLHIRLSSLINELQTGEKLPSEPELARQLGVSRATLREAMRTFETQGLIHRRQGSGTYVARPSQVIESGLEVLESIETLAKRINLPVALGEMHSDEQIATPEEAAILGLEPGEALMQVTRVILAEGQPAAYLIDILPKNVLDLSDLQEGFTGSVLDLLLRLKTLRLSSSRCEINAVTASSEVARALGIQKGDVLLRFIAYLYTATGQVVDHSFSYFLPGYFSFHVVRRVG